MFFLSLSTLKGQDSPQFLVSNSTTMIDGSASPYNLVGPGDTVYLQSGTRVNLLIKNFQGSPGAPIIFINYNGPVVFNTTWYYGIKMSNCKYVRLTGTGTTADFYGIQVAKVTNGMGLSVEGLSSDFEIDHLSIDSVPIAGIYAKTDPDCSYAATRGNFTQYNTIIHDCYITHTGDEGMYVGSSFYNGETITCNGHDTLVYPSLLSGVHIYNNIVKYSGWDGIQVGCASTDCQIYNNLIMYDSQSGTNFQMSGIMLNGGTKADCYDNTITDGKGDGIEMQGLGGTRVFNNIIVNPGLTYYPNDQTKKKYGIYVSDVSVQPDSSFYILFNDILNPKSEGIHFASVNSANNLIVSNAITHPGISGAYVVASSGCEILISNNYFAVDTIGIGFIPGGYDLQTYSPLVDAGYDECQGIDSDMMNRPRFCGLNFDIGPYEAPSVLTGITPSGSSPESVKVYPNPVRETLTVKYEAATSEDMMFSVYNLSGQRLFQDAQPSVSAGTNTFSVNVMNLSPGVYVYALRLGKHALSGRFIKLD
jgi:hypothetical protein